MCSILFSKYKLLQIEEYKRTQPQQFHLSVTDQRVCPLRDSNHIFFHFIWKKSPSSREHLVDVYSELQFQSTKDPDNKISSTQYTCQCEGWKIAGNFSRWTLFNVEPP